MAQIAPDILASVERFLAVVRQQLHIDAAYLYGSQVAGMGKPWSDIDVAVISPDFSDDLFEERLKLMKMAANIDDRIEPHPFRVEDFESTNPLVNEIQKHGILISQ